MTAKRQPTAPAAGTRWRLWRTWPHAILRPRPDEPLPQVYADAAAARRACVDANLGRFALGEAAANYECREERAG